MKFLDPTNDYVFKMIFGNENKKHILMSFLNNVLRIPAHAQIIEVTLLNPHQAPHLPGAKKTILDINCHDQMGARYIVEMQVIPQAFFDKRVLYYASKAYAHQIDKGINYDVLKPVIFLGVLDFNFTESHHYLSTHCIQDIDTQELVLRDFQFTFVELPKFQKTETELRTVEEKWLYFLKNASKLEAIPSVIHEEALKEAFEVVNRLNWNEATLDLYDQRGIQIQDEIQRVRYGYLKGEKAGEEKGLEKGLEKGREEARQTQVTILVKLLSKRFGVLAPSDLNQLEKASLQQLLVWMEKVFDAKSLEEILKDKTKIN